MGKSLSHWLRLRESADAAARSEALTRTVAETLDVNRPVSLLDLGTGTGSNIRYLFDRLPRDQRWLAVDHDATLLAELLERMSSWAVALGYDARQNGRACVIHGDGRQCRIETARMDLRSLPDEIFDARHLVTASALLDLVSAQWLQTLAGHCRLAGASALFALTYDGRFSCAPAEPEDVMVRDLLNRHQKRDKGLGGSAEGPGAVTRAQQIFSAAGFLVRSESSDWMLGPEYDGLQRELIEGWMQAAAELAADRATALSPWRERRLQHLAAGRSRIVVGHDDISAVHPAFAAEG